MRRKIEICGPSCPCGAFKTTLRCFNNYGIEPKIRKANVPEKDYVLVFETPLNWSIEKLREFNQEFNSCELMGDLRPPCHVCFSRDWKAYRETECDFCGDSIIVCKDCLKTFSEARRLFELPELFCQDCKEEDDDGVDASGTPSLTAIVCKEISKEKLGITHDAVKEKVSQKCCFDVSQTDLSQIDDAIYEALKYEIIYNKKGKLYINTEVVEENLEEDK